MPYLSNAERGDLSTLAHRRMDHPGQLNYYLTKVALAYVEDNGLCYGSVNDVMGAFASAAQEFYRRVAAPYEDKKLAQNGDVYPAEWAASTHVPKVR